MQLRVFSRQYNYIAKSSSSGGLLAIHSLYWRNSTDKSGSSRGLLAMHSHCTGDFLLQILVLPKVNLVFSYSPTLNHCHRIVRLGMNEPSHGNNLHPINPPAVSVSQVSHSYQTRESPLVHPSAPGIVLAHWICSLQEQNEAEGT